MAKKVVKKAAKKKAKTPHIPTLMDRTIAAQQAVRARNDWRSQIRDTDARTTLHDPTHASTAEPLLLK